ncbi:response regulator [Sphingomonas oleivorans]|uniref:Response regulator n=2 Tax=Sphingomonas oleivorans TaxID=1735121 RepID=A0A2T5G349_9SPHN|nr:response regulator [Sphingomonas oleivorans]
MLRVICGHVQEDFRVPDDILISVIDDDESLCLAMVGLIRSFGYRASGHGSAEAFLRSGEMARARCIVTDIHMAGLNGLELKQLLDEQECHVPVIMMTARTEEALLMRARESGALCLLQKPFPADALIGWIDKALAT